MASKVKRIRYFFFVFAFSFLAGSAYFIFENFGLFSLKGYVLETPSADIEKHFWELLPAECIRYWPVFVYKSSQIRELMEKTTPVLVSTEAKGVGLFHTRITYLEPWLMVEWRQKDWYLSQEGYMWAPELYDFGIPKSPTWEINESLSRYSGAGTPDGVFPAVFSIEELKRFDSIFSAQSWYTNVMHIGFDRRAGEYLLKISLDISGGKVVLIINGEEDKLYEIDNFLKQVLAQIILDEKEIYIDMSYSDKIVVTRAREGSLK
ncbi:MAG: hypothetical protein FWH52_06255 [Synergistaceae bacterium]|nr:hypothetical protein [Synergistaceae bacterium]